ncbi:hypothetical protein CENSYa_1774 [Cenarchaeum symbiosum A]|uniref:Uncharacterized protein n=1 Tax=Cenarchaeum symbiosum (strain A) TaxID=414004 RepID=A0RYG7_CENSY|nr:hypothetical protein CENSYa_1774 [Cenarchaeum symbiosum A]
MSPSRVKQECPECIKHLVLSNRLGSGPVGPESGQMLHPFHVRDLACHV